MESPIQTTTRYPDADLAEFKEVIEKKLAVAYEELEYLRDQINDTTENMEKDSDYMEDSTSYSDLEMFQNMLHRQQKHAQNLENALLRVKNKSYGICTVTGKLIDKRRLLIVPTTTMSIDAKLADNLIKEKIEKETKRVTATPDPDDAMFLESDKPASRPSAPKPANKIPLDDLDIFDADDEDVAPEADFEMGEEQGAMDDDY